MAFFASSILKTTNFFCNPMPHSTSSSQRKISHHSIPCIKIQSWRFRSLPKREFLPVTVSSRLRRPPRRRNSLREKLIDSGGAQVRKIAQIPVVDSDWQGFDPAFDGNNVIDSNSDEKFDLSGSGSSVLWDKLENWVDQYKRDSEFWGIGSGHVFTVYQDSEDNVVRVLVNEDEIAKRSQFKALSFQQKDGIDEISDARSKISHAKRIAKEIEAGEYVIPKSSSIAKFVVEGKKASLVEGLGSVSLWVEPFFKLMPRIGFMTLCGCCIFWAVSKLFVVSEMEPSSEEVEMLRRKKKARTKKNEVNKDNVEVLQDVLEFPVEPYTRPELDRSELMKSIIHGKTSRNTLALMETSSGLDVEGQEFKEKVKEIREMAREARELERQEHAQLDEKGEGDDISSLLLAAKGGRASKYVYTGTNSKKEEPHEDDIGSIGPFADSKMLVAEEVNCLNSSSDGGFSETITSGNGAVTTPVRDLNSDVTRLLDQIPKKKDAENTAHGGNTRLNEVKEEESESNTRLNEVKEEESESKNMDAINFPEKKTYNSSTDAFSRGPVSRKPKIIMSVKEARQYLAQKHAAPLVDVQSSPVMQVKGATGVHKAHSGAFCSKAIEKKVQATNSDAKLIEPSKQNKLNDHGLVSTAFDLSDSSHANAFANKMHRDEVSGSKSLQAANESQKLFIKSENSMMKGKTDPKSQIRNDDNRIGELSDESMNISSDSPNVISGMTSVGSDGISSCQELQNCRIGNHMPGPKFERHKDCTCVSEKKIVGTNINEVNIMKSKKVELSMAHMEHGTTLLADPANLKACGPQTSLHDSKNEQDLNNLSIPEVNLLQDSSKSDCNTEAKPAKAEESWLEKNFQEFDPIIKKMAVGFKENYMMAKEKVNEMPSLSADISNLRLIDGNEELEWMNDENLREIVFQVRDNELAGRDPFHLMDADDKRAFFGGLERKVEKLNKKLLGLHEWVHSMVENIDYGADGISLDDPPEKIIPRWKGPLVDRDSAFFKSSKDDLASSLQRPQQAQNSSGSPLSPVNARGKGGDSVNPKTIIECSDGSSRAGKKKGKEHWEHTKRWSQGFLEVYNAETDPEIKSILTDMGKDLDRWFTEKDRQDVADLVMRFTERRRKFIEKKIDKIKREMQMFGSQAVISKYKEYSDEKEEDYLWWLDLRFVLCIELYTIEDGKPRVGFYSLEMATDLDLNPKQYHVIAFEDPGDSKNFCHIIQAHMDMLGSGKAFVIARPPKDAFREAKTNGFNVTVIRKGEVKLNVDQTLEEVEEGIVEIGSKIYHDKIMRERSIDVRALMKGVINAEKSTKRSREVLKKP